MLSLNAATSPGSFMHAGLDGSRCIVSLLGHVGYNLFTTWGLKWLETDNPEDVDLVVVAIVCSLSVSLPTYTSPCSFWFGIIRHLQPVLGRACLEKHLHALLVTSAGYKMERLPTLATGGVLGHLQGTRRKELLGACVFSVMETTLIWLDNRSDSTVSLSLRMRFVVNAGWSRF